MAPVVSVVIPTFKRDLLLKKCLDALLEQTMDQSAYEIIIVDDAGRDATRELVEAYSRGNGPPIRYLTCIENHGPAAARNRGWRAAQAPFIAFTDDDCLPEPDWLARGTAAFDENVAGVSGRTMVPVSATPNDYERNTSLLATSEFVTANCFYRKKVLADAGGFDERFTRAWREDADLYFTLLSRNARLITAPDAVVVHPVRKAAWGISMREQRKSMFNALLFKKHPELYLKKIGNDHRFGYYAIVASASLFLAAMASGLGHLGVIPFSLWMTFTLSLFLRRLESTSRSATHISEMFVTSLLIPFQSVFWRLTGAVRFKVLFY
ncbi:MAG: glycosyl transferase family 2 [Nitrospirae bacterium GWD2_57_9]|nr:MAG: glycosyl transferase family 2 [Nitrospirae bacterium GWD2_57_9]